MLLDNVVRASVEVAGTRSRLRKRSHLATLLRRLAPDERAPVCAWLCGELAQGKLGVGWATVGGTRVEAASVPSRTVAEVDGALSAIGRIPAAGPPPRRRPPLPP